MSKNPHFCNGEENEKQIRNPHTVQIRITTKSQSLLEGRSPLANVCQVWSTSVSMFVSYPVYRMTEQRTE